MNPAPAKKPRDVRLDFFRGLSLVAIFTAHVPGDWLAEIIWARFGLSDAAHVFVFISGYAAAMAFGGTFVKQGFLVGTARIAWRCAQLIPCTWRCSSSVRRSAPSLQGIDYAAYLGISDFFADPGRTLLGLFTLRFVPTYFDILPLYMLVLACVPLVLLLAAPCIRASSSRRPWRSGCMCRRRASISIPAYRPGAGGSTRSPGAAVLYRLRAVARLG